MAKVGFKNGTAAQYNSLVEIDNYTFYYLEDASELYFGSTKISNASDVAAVVGDVAQNAGDIADIKEVLTKIEGDESVNGSIRNIVGGYVSQIMAVEGTNGTSLIYNEGDGSGTKFEHDDGTESFIGVSDGGEYGITGQIYSAKNNVGSRLNMTNDGIYYVKGNTAIAHTANDELVTKKDLQGISGDASGKTVYLVNESNGETRLYQGSDADDMTNNTLVGTVTTVDKFLADAHIVTITYRDGHLFDDLEDVTDLIIEGGGSATILDAGKYIKMELQNVSAPLYVDVRSLVDTYTPQSDASQIQLAIDNSNTISGSIVDGGVTADKLSADAKALFDQAGAAAALLGNEEDEPGEATIYGALKAAKASNIQWESI